VHRVLLVVIILILGVSLFPFHFDFSRIGEQRPGVVLLHSWPKRFDRHVLRDGAANALPYVLLGWLTFVAFGSTFRPWQAVGAALVLGTSLSAIVEAFRIFEPSHVCSLFDLACSLAGTAGGAFIATTFPARWEPRD
jgi:VanZ family protein